MNKISVEIVHETSDKKAKKKIKQKERCPQRWTERQLIAFGIYYDTIQFDQMFSEEERKEPMIDVLDLLQNSWESCVKDGEVQMAVIKTLDERIQYFWTMFSLVQMFSEQEKRVDSFIHETFRLAHLYDLPYVVLGASLPLKLIMDDQATQANPDIHVMDLGSNHTILLVHKDKSKYNDVDDPFAQRRLLHFKQNGTSV